MSNSIIYNQIPNFPPMKGAGIGVEKIANIIFSAQARADKVISELLITPQSIIPSTTDISLAPFQVFPGNIIRIRVTTQTYIAFGPATMTAPSATTPNAIELFSAGVYLVVASDMFIMASTNPARIEILNGLN